MTTTELRSSKLALPAPYSDVIVCTDGTGDMGPTLVTGRSLADAFRGECRLVHGVAEHHVARAKLYDVALQQAAKLQVELDTVEAHERVSWNIAVPLVTYLAARPQSLPVFGTHGRNRAGRALLGSVSAAVVRDLARPVVVLGPAVRSAPEQINRIVACTDGSPSSIAAVSAAAGLARDLKAPLWLVEVLEPGSADATNLHAIANDCETLGVHANWETLHERHPQRAIIDFIGTDPTTLTVMATHGHSGWRDLLMGSTTTDVIRHSAGPVVVLHPSSPVSPALSAPKDHQPIDR